MNHHNHSHNHALDPTSINKAFIVGIALNLLFVVVEVGVGLTIGSLSLLSDAGHNFADVGTLALSLLAFRLVKVKSNNHYTYGYRKISILVALFNSMMLILSIGVILYEAIQRLIHPEPLSGGIISAVAAIGIAINGATTVMFSHGKNSDINIKSAYLHMLSDTAVSFGLVIGGVFIYFTKWFWIDSLWSIVVALLILFSTWKLLTESVRLSLDGVPFEINLDQIKLMASKIDGVLEIHHIHIWAISTTENAMTAHLVLRQNVTTTQELEIKNEFRHQLEHKKISHITLETEYESQLCDVKIC